MIGALCPCRPSRARGALPRNAARYRSARVGTERRTLDDWLTLAPTWFRGSGVLGERCSARGNGHEPQHRMITL